MKAKVLIIGKKGGILQWYEHMIAAAHHLPDMHIEGFALNYNHWQDRLRKRIIKLSGKKNQLDSLNANELRKKINDVQPDLIIILDLFIFSEQMLNTLASAKPKARIVQWIGDFFTEKLKANQTAIDHFYFTDSSFIADAHAFGIQNASHLPLAVNPDLFHPPETENNRIPQLLFIGAYSENRRELINAVHAPKTLIGKGWSRVENAADKIIGKNISIKKVASLYREYAIILNVLNRNNVRHGLNMRCFEATASGALLITESSPDNESCFIEGKEILAYSSPDELNQQLEMLMKQPEQIKAIALRGQKRTLGEHCYHHRILQIHQGPY